MKNRWLLIASPLVLIAGLLTARVLIPPVIAQMGPMSQQPLEQLSGDAFDKAFLTEMTMHHAMAVMMARPVVANASHPELQGLATNIINDQTREIAQMRGWARDWYGVTIPDPVAMMDSAMAPADPMAGMDHGGMMPTQQNMPTGMMSNMPMMADLWKLPSPRLEAVFLTMMIPHHQGAIDMAMLVADHTAHQELKDLAQGIMQSQTGEITTMSTWLSSWYGL